MNDAIHQFAAAMRSAGINPPESIVADGALHRFSTNGRRYDAAGWYVLNLSSKPYGHFGCWRRGISLAWSTYEVHRIDDRQLAEHRSILAKERHRRSAEEMIRQARNAKRNAEIMGQSKPAGREVKEYLQSRGLSAWEIPMCIREHPGLTYWHEDERGVLHDLGRYPAMIAPVIRDGTIVSIHRTFLYQGAKAHVPNPKRLTCVSAPLAGSHIPLAQPKGGVLGIAEGIETAAAASLGARMPVVAAYCAHALGSFAWPQGVEHLVIFADNDFAGQKAAQELCGRAQKAGLITKTVTPSKPGVDWADVWKESQS